MGQEPLGEIINKITQEIVAGIIWNSEKLKAIIKMVTEQPNLRCAVKEIEDVPLDVVVSRMLYKLNGETKRMADEILIDAVNIFGELIREEPGAQDTFDKITATYDQMTDHFERASEERRFSDQGRDLEKMICEFADKISSEITTTPHQTQRGNALVRGSFSKSYALDSTPEMGAKRTFDVENGEGEEKPLKIDELMKVEKLTLSNYSTTKRLRTKRITKRRGVIVDLEAIQSTLDGIAKVTHYKLGDEGFNDITFKSNGSCVVASTEGNIYEISLSDLESPLDESQMLSCLDHIRNIAIDEKDRLMFTQLQTGTHLFCAGENTHFSKCFGADKNGSSLLHIKGSLFSILVSKNRVEIFDIDSKNLTPETELEMAEIGGSIVKMIAPRMQRSKSKIFLLSQNGVIAYMSNSNEHSFAKLPQKTKQEEFITMALSEDERYIAVSSISVPIEGREINYLYFYGIDVSSGSLVLRLKSTHEYSFGVDRKGCSISSLDFFTYNTQEYLTFLSSIDSLLFLYKLGDGKIEKIAEDDLLGKQHPKGKARIVMRNNRGFVLSECGPITVIDFVPN